MNDSERLRDRRDDRYSGYGAARRAKPGGCLADSASATDDTGSIFPCDPTQMSAARTPEVRQHHRAPCDGVEALTLWCGDPERGGDSVGITMPVIKPIEGTATASYRPRGQSGNSH